MAAAGAIFVNVDLVQDALSGPVLPGVAPAVAPESSERLRPLWPEVHVVVGGT